MVLLICVNLLFELLLKIRVLKNVFGFVERLPLKWLKFLFIEGRRGVGGGSS